MDTWEASVSQNDTPQSKLTWAPPTLIEHGDLRELTRLTLNGVVEDQDFGPNNSTGA